MPDIDESHIESFSTPYEFSAWLEKNHDKESELWLKIYKKASGKQSINWKEAVIEALCWGWIDGVKKTLDADAYMQRFTPRRPKSNWSKRNTEHVEMLIKEGRMKEPGHKHVSNAMADGRWEAAYAPSSEMVMPKDFIEALDRLDAAKEYFESLRKSSKFIIATGLQTAKKPETRQRRFDKYLLMLKNKEKFN